MSHRVRLAAVATTTFVSTVGLTVATPSPASADVRSSQTFAYTGAPQTFTVPFGVTALDFDAVGAAGGNALDWTGSTGLGGLGGRITGTLTVTPGDMLTVVVGGRGANGANGSASGTGAGGYNGGGNGGAPGDSGGQGAGGGGASDIRAGGASVATRIFAAAGGGGASPTIPGGGVGAAGGHGGGAVGQDGGARSDHESAGKGATTTAGGASASAPGYAAGTSGGLGYGGAGGSYTFYANGEGGGGGGGYYGGGGGGTQNAPIAGGYYYGGTGGGGGSSFAVPDAVGVVNLAGQRSGDGVVVLTWIGLPVAGGTPSNDCTSGSIIDATTAGVYTKLRVQAVGPTTVWVCFRVDAGSLGRIGGKVVVPGTAGVGALPRVDAASTACSSTAGNAIPGPHPLVQGTVGDALLSYLVDTYASSTEAWLCLSVSAASVMQNVRIVVPATSVTLPDITVLWDADSTLI